ncbi:hypothetical protein DICPUDRAFT_27593 [Dictyostelium purpureum]|uniref:DNA repair protein rad9 n=1 Tax=Dictyostelium purpureum TaxID=5786 RepID=F0ZAG6_DICPU|nr:uncharacterized protein DICPUDRAFT_27593 [Dictyostelium purpureum]EGC39065.1 hypothetical protein DICPUDRAFT_27593 [Dictyostelium purpureum]|eukprot:XP_003284415.1 hypothetical protein DICPUDRAFT_27593 [Dictyostelium purpureum]
MHFVVASRHIKQFSKSLQCISRIGDDLYIEIHEDFIKFVTVNSSRSAYATFTFHSSFFQNYIFEKDDIIPQNQYRVKSKLCFQMFHSLSNIDKCAMKIVNDESKITFYLLCKNGIQKIYSMNYEESQCPAAVFNRDPPYKITAKPKQLSDCLNFFSSNVEEIAMLIQKDRVILRSQVDEKKPNTKALATEVTVDYQDFDNYVFRGPGAEISFGYKDIKTILAYIDVINNPYTMLIDQCGRPFNISFNYNSTFHADFILATLYNSNQPRNAQQAQQYQSAPPVTPQHQYFADSSSFNSRSEHHQNYRNTSMGSPNTNQNYQQQPIFSSHEDDHDDMMDGMPLDHDLQQQQQQTPNSNYQYNISQQQQQQNIYQHSFLPHSFKDQHDLQQYDLLRQQQQQQQQFDFQQYDLQQQQQQQFDFQQNQNIPLSNTSVNTAKRTTINYRSDINLDEDDDDDDDENENIQSSNN